MHMKVYWTATATHEGESVHVLLYCTSYRIPAMSQDICHYAIYAYTQWVGILAMSQDFILCVIPSI